MAVIAVTTETHPDETRVALTPDAVRKLIAAGSRVVVQSGAGDRASYPDSDFQAAGAEIAPDSAAAVAGADVLLKVREPEDAEIAALKPGTIVIGLFNPYQDEELVDALAA